MKRVDNDKSFVYSTAFKNSNLSKKEAEKLYEENLNCAAKTLQIFNFEKEDKRTIIADDNTELSEKDVLNYLKTMDKNGDGEISEEEALDDKFNLLHINDSAEIRNGLSEEFETQSLMSGINGIGIGLSFWGVAKNTVVKNTTPDQLKDLLGNDQIIQYVQANFSEKQREHFKELLEIHGMNPKDYPLD